MDETWEFLVKVFALIGFFVALNYHQKILDRTRFGSEGVAAILLGIPLFLGFVIGFYFFIKELFWQGNLDALWMLLVLLPYGVIFSGLFLGLLKAFIGWLRQKKS